MQAAEGHKHTTVARPGEMSATQLVAKTCVYGIVDIGAYLALEEGLNFIPGFVLFSAIFVLTILLERLYYGRDLWLQLPIGNTAFTLVAFFVPTYTVYSSDLLRELTGWNDYFVLKAMFISIIGLHAVWSGFAIGKAATPRIQIFKRDVPIPISRIMILLGIYLLSVLVSIITGTYGITQTQEMQTTSQFTQYLHLGQQLGYFAVILLVLYHYRSRRNMILLLVALLFISGLLSGRKSFAMFFLLAVGISLYYINRRVPKTMILVFVAALGVTFSIVTTFRTYYFQSGKESISSLSELTSDFGGALSDSDYRAYSSAQEQMDHMLTRFYYGGSVSKAFEYVEDNGHFVPDDSQPHHALLAPFYAFMPRVIFQFKPTATFGQWMTQEVFGLGKHQTYSIGITQNGTAFMWGGYLGVILLLAFAGVFQAILYKATFTSMKSVYVFLLMSNFIQSQVLWSYISGTVQVLVVLAIALFFLRVNFSLQPTAQLSTSGDM